MLKKLIKTLMVTLMVITTFFSAGTSPVYAEDEEEIPYSDDFVDVITELGPSYEVFPETDPGRVMLRGVNTSIGTRMAKIYIANQFGYDYISYLYVGGNVVFCIEPMMLFEDGIEYEENYAKSPEQTVYRSIQFFTLQQKYSFDFFYEIADAMETLNIKSFPDMKDRLMTVAGQYKCLSSLPDLHPEAAADSDRKIEYQLILQRRRIIPQLISNNAIVDIILGAFLEGNTLVNAIRSHMHLGGKPLPQVIAEETTIEDWASVFEIYDVSKTLKVNIYWMKK